ncbi:enterochelin esterase domain-containing protein [Microbulbifer epialgicus]|uniref:Enterochelin esterase domain-containing protein n=1 Tax=Microbulbifer epialgicus TaxID=393907 RepID=A0ABV4P4G1_9GAMM
MPSTFRAQIVPILSHPPLIYFTINANKNNLHLQFDISDVSYRLAQGLPLKTHPEGIKGDNFRLYNSTSKMMSASMLSITKSLFFSPKLKVGSKMWWDALAKQGLPLVNKKRFEKSQSTLTCLWHDPYGKKTESEIKAVYTDINSVTSRQTYHLAALTRLMRTGIWFMRLQTEIFWLGGYRLIPVTENFISSNWVEQSAANSKLEQNCRLLRNQLLTSSIPDPPNISSLKNGTWGKEFSAIYLPNTLQQEAWKNYDLVKHIEDNPVLQGHIKEESWHSQIFQVRRKVWNYTYGSPHEYQSWLLILIYAGLKVSVFWTSFFPSPQVRYISPWQLPVSPWLWCSDLIV